MTTVPMAAPWWRGAVEWVARHDAEWWQPWRLLPHLADTAYAPDLLRVATMAAGVRLEVTTDASRVRLAVRSAHDAPVALDVVVDSTLARRVSVPPGVSEVHADLPGGSHRIELWLPQFGVASYGPVTLDGASFATPVDARPRWTTYGSSITQCSGAAGPSETWPALVARRLGWDLTCAGFSGQCHLDPIAAATIAETPADIVSLCLGVNMYGANSYGPRTFAGHVAAFVRGVRAAHPAATILVISPIVCPRAETTPNATGQTLAGIRSVVAGVTRDLQKDDADLHLLDGPAVLGHPEVALLPDGLHPNAEGYHHMARRIGDHLATLAAGRRRGA